MLGLNFSNEILLVYMFGQIVLQYHPLPVPSNWCSWLHPFSLCSLTRFFIISWLLFFGLSIKRTASHLFATATNFDSSSAENIYILRDSQSAIFPSGNNNIGRCWVSEKSKSWEPTSPIEMVSSQQHCTRTKSVPFNKNHNQARRMPPKWSILWSTNHLWFDVDAIKAVMIQEHLESRSDFLF